MFCKSFHLVHIPTPGLYHFPVGIGTVNISLRMAAMLEHVTVRWGEEKKYIPAMHKPHIPYVSGISASLCGGKFIEPHHGLTSVLSAFPDTVTPGWGILIGTQWVRSPGVPCSLPLRLIEGTLLKVILFFQLPPLAKRAFVSACWINPPHQYVTRDAANRTVGHTCSVRAAPTEL